MVRNINRPLTVDEAATVAHFSPSLFTLTATGEAVTVAYRKDDGTLSSSTGTIDPVTKGIDSTLAIVVHDDSKPYAPTINVRNIVSICGV
jgi:hypothetical protein